MRSRKIQIDTIFAPVGHDVSILHYINNMYLLCIDFTLCTHQTTGRHNGVLYVYMNEDGDATTAHVYMRMVFAANK